MLVALFKKQYYTEDSASHYSHGLVIYQWHQTGWKRPMILGPCISSLSIIQLLHSWAYFASSTVVTYRAADLQWTDHFIYPIVQCLFCDECSLTNINAKTSLCFMPASIGPSSCCFSKTLYKEHLLILILLGLWPTSHAIYNCIGVHEFSNYRLLIFHNNIDDQLYFASISLNIHSLAYYLSIFWFILGRS